METQYILDPITALDSNKLSVELIREARDSIPSLNQRAAGHVLRDGVLVRFRCMIQDNLDKVLKHKKAGDVDLKYRRGVEGISGTVEFSRDFYDVERFIAVTVPGEALEGVSESLARLYISGVSDKRERTEAMTDEAEPKRARESVDSEEPPTMVPVSGEVEVETETAHGLISPHPIPASLVAPDVASRRVSAVLNVCDMSLDFKLHEVIEVVGVISKLVPEDCLALPTCDYSIEVIDAIKIPPSLPEPMTRETAAVARSALKTVLTRLLHNDEVAAEYVLLQLVSARVAGNEALPTLGSWGLCLSNAETVDVPLLARFIQSVVDGPTVSLEASNAVLMNDKFYPVRPVESDFTHPGALQLASNSTVVIDERGLGEGQVNALNVLAITKAVREQELMAVFGSSDIINFKLDCRFLILNAGRNKSLFANTNPEYGVLGSSPFVAIELRPAAPSKLTDVDIALTDADLVAVRNYVRAARSLVATVAITEPVIEQFQKDWVESRKTDPSIPTEDIDAWATLLRIMAASRGSPETTMNDWTAILKWEAHRRSRNPIVDCGPEGRKTASDPVVTGA